MLLLSLALLWGCEPAPEAIRYGEDGCTRCKMLIMDQKFGAELVTAKGKVYTFDSIECLAAFYLNEDIPKTAVHSLWVTSFDQPGQLTEASTAVYLHSERLPSPMGMNLSGYPSNSSAQRMQAQVNGDILDWEGVLIVVKEKWLGDRSQPNCEEGNCCKPGGSASKIAAN